MSNATPIWPPAVTSIRGQDPLGMLTSAAAPDIEGSRAIRHALERPPSPSSDASNIWRGQ
jgi:hypothetical protein